MIHSTIFFAFSNVWYSDTPISISELETSGLNCQSMSADFLVDLMSLISCPDFPLRWVVWELGHRKGSYFIRPLSIIIGKSPYPYIIYVAYLISQ